MFLKRFILFISDNWFKFAIIVVLLMMNTSMLKINRNIADLYDIVSRLNYIDSSIDSVGSAVSGLGTSIFFSRHY